MRTLFLGINSLQLTSCTENAAFLYPELDPDLFTIIVGKDHKGWYAILTHRKDQKQHITLAIGVPVAEQDKAFEGLLTVLAGEVGKSYSYVWQKSPVDLQGGGHIAPSSRRQNREKPPAYEEIVRS